MFSIHLCDTKNFGKSLLKVAFKFGFLCSIMIFYLILYYPLILTTAIKSPFKKFLINLIDCFHHYSRSYDQQKEIVFLLILL